MSTALDSPPGWHGKLPSLGDFASRRLDSAFVDAWDGWLAAGLLALRTADPAGWLDAYLASPSWRFLLMPGTLPGDGARQGWAGVLMPSVDRVGRYFPLTIALPLGERLPASTQQMQALWHWLGRLDELAADALQDDWNVDRLESELARMAQPELQPLAAPAAAALAPGGLVELPLTDGVDAAVCIGVEAQALWRDRAAGLAYWFASTDLAHRLVVSRGLPATLGTLLAATIADAP